MRRRECGVTDPGDLPGYTTGIARSTTGRTAVLHSVCDPEFPWWFSLLVRCGDGWCAPLPSDLRLSGPVVLATDDGTVAVSAFRGIRRGVVMVRPDSGEWWWATPDDDASYVEVAPEPSGLRLRAARVGLDGARVPVRIDRDGRVQVSGPRCAGAAGVSVRLVRWQVPEGPLEGVLAVPSVDVRARWPLVVDLHGGPVAAFQAGDVGRLAEWCARGFAAFAPEFRASGILGPEPMMRTFRGDGFPDEDREVADVLAGVAAVVETGGVDPGRMFVAGHSYGAYLANRIVTVAHPFRAVVCWEGVADLRLLTGPSLRTQTRWRGGSPQERPDAWAAASPVERADRIAVPVLLAYGERGLADPHGAAWYAALRRHRVRCACVVYPGEGHTFAEPATGDLLDRAAAWFRAART